MIELNKTQRKQLSRSKRELRAVFRSALESLKNVDDQAVVGLKEAVDRKGVRGFVEELVGGLFESGFNNHQEFRLNKAGFKMWIWMEKDGRLKAYAHGDQRWSHPIAYRYFTKNLHFHCLLPRDRNPVVLP